MQKKHDWQSSLSNSITDVDSLLHAVELDINMLDASSQACRDFPLRVPHEFAERMQKGNPCDPLLLQVLPIAKELEKFPGYSHDPLNEKASNPVPGLLHKYHGRVLLTLTGGCAINCRYCFRRHFPYSENTLSIKRWEPALAYIKNNPEIEEVILSGGDPLLVKDHLLLQLVDQISDISHVSRLRIHTRLPIVIPSRITNDLTKLLKETRLESVIVIHCNHANEIDNNVATAIKKLLESGATVLNQSVLLHGVNDNAECLINLSKQLFTIGVIPYYLHLLDPVVGAAHFDVAEASAKVIVKRMLEKLPGYLVPKLVRELAGQPHKTPVFL